VLVEAMPPDRGEWDDLTMRDRKTLALLALALVEGSLRVGDAVDEMFIDTFESLEEAAFAHAYLAGYVLQFLAVQRAQTVAQTASEIRRSFN
jgi:hypothetical protein